MLACNEPGGYRMPVLKQVFKLSANKASRYPSSKETERQRILHFVFEDARRRVVGLKSVCMFPIGEWSGNLEIAEIAAWFVLLMHGDPTHAKGPSAKSHHDSRPALDSSDPLEHFDVLPGRREPLKRVRQGVPRVQVSRRSLNS